ncbi:hypothetical protein A3C20_00240 [Candidatus Kaiserbacteria bacterium RIFCSPHIGHO2_02_FULL_55_25]|uniref:DNA polymerase III subunit delta n=1 Tax=Candidatus Kaiserbacteria bacterium RIFCSPHIGHO2_02_FULL_55_25 TaxID=1798498 RepID=A0A1F6E5V4_9BACT|nr:MAG: hypothetical protein A3C20_00240 [Candidatus Kaiserbacteria bacterium RIFCSPHIGHO2_02_FULL_55_25]OGG76893.1 MAG: hypothetical protein A3F56_00520 [Candidatus Kaiserbacteria bacterium RIFCSPHIGHO2_12_FULL_55_13]OGG84130.1 MAG: hypothetical protein A3A42_03770 [Candidatus Kaiserbacteria bacterium RIFCSPLOWO2_01_FULL_55_25]
MELMGSAHLVAGNAETISDVLALLERQGIATVSNPDVYVRTYTHFGIDEARELRDRASMSALGGGGRAFIIAASGMTNEAQNALLKTLEEPPAGSSFYIIVSSPETLLPTLRSRMQMLDLGPSRTEGLVDAKSFLAAAPAKRLDMLKPLLEKNDDDRRDIGAVIAFLSSLERALAAHPEGLRSVYRARKYMSDKGALVKPLLEQVALLVPRV